MADANTWTPPQAQESTHIRSLPTSSTNSVSACCHAPLAHDATRAYCTKCNRVDYDLNDGGVAEGHYYCCPDCGGAGELDDITRCSTCDGDGMVEA
jgi:hypothetical protein